MPFTQDIFRDSVTLVTGATGFIGSHLVARLCSLGSEVHGVARSAPNFEHNQFHPWQVDLCNYDAGRRMIKSIKPDYVFHLASHVMGAPDLSHVLPAFHNNLETTANLLTACADSGYGKNRVILTGSLVEPPPDELDTAPSSPYAAAKLASSSYARMFSALYELPTSIARVFMVYGPAQRDETKLVPYVIRNLLANQTPKITSGERLIDWIYVTDVVEGFLAIAAAAGGKGESIDLGTGKLTSTHDFVMKIVDLMDSDINPAFGSLPDRPLEPNRTANVELSYRQTGWRSNVSLDEGLRHTIAYYRELLK